MCKIDDLDFMLFLFLLIFYLKINKKKTIVTHLFFACNILNIFNYLHMIY